MAFSPTIPFRFVSPQIVHNHMDLLVGIFRNQLIHEVQKLPTETARIMARFHFPGGHIQGSKKCGRSMASILMIGSRPSYPQGSMFVRGGSRGVEISG